jgi:hypothetical protein
MLSNTGVKLLLLTENQQTFDVFVKEIDCSLD